MSAGMRSEFFLEIIFPPLRCVTVQNLLAVDQMVWVGCIQVDGVPKVIQAGGVYTGGWGA